MRQIGTLFNQTPRTAYVHITPDATHGIKNTPLFFIFCRYADYISDMYTNMIILYVFSVQKNNLQYIKTTDM